MGVGRQWGEGEEGTRGLENGGRKANQTRGARRG